WDSPAVSQRSMVVILPDRVPLSARTFTSHPRSLEAARRPSGVRIRLPAPDERRRTRLTPKIRWRRTSPSALVERTPMHRVSRRRLLGTSRAAALAAALPPASAPALPRTEPTRAAAGHGSQQGPALRRAALSFTLQVAAPGASCSGGCRE